MLSLLMCLPGCHQTLVIAAVCLCRHIVSIPLCARNFPAQTLMLKTGASSASLSSEKLTAENCRPLEDFENDCLVGASPNRTKYEELFIKRDGGSARRPLGEKTNSVAVRKANEKTSREQQDEAHQKTGTGKGATGSGASSGQNADGEGRASGSQTENGHGAAAGGVTFEDLFSLPSAINGVSPVGATVATTPSKVEELTLALADTLRENEELHDTVKLLKAEIERLNEEMEERREYAELYLLTRELIETQAEELVALRRQLEQNARRGQE